MGKKSRSPSSRTVPVTGASDIRIARNTARQLASALSFDEVRAEEIALAASELASNLVKHTVDGGVLEIIPLQDGTRHGLQILSLDQGPGIADVEAAIADGVSTTGSLGYGLGAVNRLMDTLEIGHRQDGPGTKIACTRWIRTEGRHPLLDRISIGIASRPHRQMPVNGDAYVVKKWETHVLLGVIDGVGHGEGAHQAARQARHYVETHCDQPLDQLFRGVGRVCRGPRGVVMALARVDLDRETLSFASIGNIEARTFGIHAPMNFVMRRGILGASAPSPVVTDHRWTSGHILVLQSDGVASRWRWTDIPALEEKSAETLAWEILRQWGKDEDDATVAVLKCL